MNHRKNFESINSPQYEIDSDEELRGDEEESTPVEVPTDGKIKIERQDRKLNLRKFFQAGSTVSSVFSLIIICLGAGTLSIPYVFYENGVILGSVLLFSGGLLSIYTGYLIVVCCDRLQVYTYEEMAKKTYGQRASFITSMCMLACLLGFVVLYIVLFKELMPFTLEILIGADLPHFWQQESQGGRIIWSLIFSYALVFPLSLPRNLSSLRFSSMFGFLINMYIILTIILTCFFDKEVNPDLAKGIDAALRKFHLSGHGIFSSLPIVIFSFMYQPNIPMIYKELDQKTKGKMTKVLNYGSFGAAVAYFSAGVLGYMTFAANPQVDELMNQKNILLCYPFEGAPQNIISLIGIQLVICMSTPLTILPCKDTIEQLFLPPGSTFTPKQNLLATLSLVTICFILSIALTNLGDAMIILGATTNAAIGFLLPIVFYLKIEKPEYRKKRVIAKAVFVAVFMVSIVELVYFLIGKL